MPEKKVHVGIIDSTEDCLNLMGTIIREAGFRTAGKLFPKINYDQDNYKRFLTEFNPTVLIIEVLPPYGENWKRIWNWMVIDEMRGRRGVLTTTDARWRENFAGKPETVEILEKPFENETLVKVVARSYWTAVGR